ncbi:hypothetical protein [Rhodopila sp.]|uniref:hypothetical protein n=1 Tax=Rhodopila sp. TaxID=2480087 RepID=UPI003D0A0F0C
MSETTTRGEPATHDALPIRPSDVLISLLINLLAPMFLCGSGGNVEFARLAARETVEAYRVSSRMDLLAVAQIVAFGLAALGSLSLSMADGIGLPMMLRLRGNAASLNRAAEQNRRALERSQAAPPATEAPATEPYDEAYENEVLESLRQTEIMVAQARAELAAQAAAVAVADAPVAGSVATAAKPVLPANPAASANPAQVAGFAPASPLASPRMPVPAAADARGKTGTAAIAGSADPILTASERTYRTMFAAAMTEVAGEYVTDLSNQPPAQRREASIRAEALRSSASALLAGSEPPPFTFSLRDMVRPPNAE